MTNAEALEKVTTTARHAAMLSITIDSMIPIMKKALDLKSMDVLLEAVESIEMHNNLFKAHAHGTTDSENAKG